MAGTVWLSAFGDRSARTSPPAIPSLQQSHDRLAQQRPTATGVRRTDPGRRPPRPGGPRLAARTDEGAAPARRLGARPRPEHATPQMVRTRPGTLGGGAPPAHGPDIGRRARRGGGPGPDHPPGVPRRAPLGRGRRPGGPAAGAPDRRGAVPADEAPRRVRPRGDAP